jgi:hypothetical protein
MDQTQCAIDCNAPVLSSISSNCDTNVFTLVNSNVNASATPSTIVEVSLSPTGFPVTQRYTQTGNVDGNNTYNVNISSLGIIPGTTIYFRLINLCNGGTIESAQSNALSSVCTPPPIVPPPPPPPPPPSTVRINYDFRTLGGYSPGYFQLNVNGGSSIGINYSESGVVEAPLNSIIDVFINAPLADTTGGGIPVWTSQIIVSTNTGGVVSNNGTTAASVLFTLTEEVYINGITQVASTGGGGGPFEVMV